jgi:3-methylfumaryl-CoA hydratase
MTVDTAHLADWVGRTRTEHDHVSPSDIRRLAACLDRAPPPGEGASLPPAWHWALFQPGERQSELGVDGHPRVGDFLPPISLPRRMFVEISIATAKPLRIGDSVTRVSKIASITPKEGRQGTLVFVTMQHTLTSSGGGAIVEEHRIVFRDKAEPGAKPRPEESPQTMPAIWQAPFVFDPVVVFRFCAATFNAHRIHYDRDYAIGVEGYPNPLVPGRLAALMLLEALRAQDERPVVHFSFKAGRPLWVGEQARGCGCHDGNGGATLWIESGAGVAMTATARFKPDLPDQAFSRRP